MCSRSSLQRSPLGPLVGATDAVGARGEVKSTQNWHVLYYWSIAASVSARGVILALGFCLVLRVNGRFATDRALRPARCPIKATSSLPPYCRAGPTPATKLPTLASSSILCLYDVRTSGSQKASRHCPHCPPVWPNPNRTPRAIDRYLPCDLDWRVGLGGRRAARRAPPLEGPLTLPPFPRHSRTAASRKLQHLHLQKGANRADVVMAPIARGNSLVVAVVLALVSWRTDRGALRRTHHAI